MNMNKLMISNRVLDSIKTHLEVSAPYVAGGFFLANPTKDQAEVVDFKPALNIIDGIPNQFLYSSEDFDLTIVLGQQRALEVSGIYASVSSKDYAPEQLFINKAENNTYYLVGVIQNNELVAVDAYYYTADAFNKCSLAMVEALEV